MTTIRATPARSPAHRPHPQAVAVRSCAGSPGALRSARCRAPARRGEEAWRLELPLPRIDHPKKNWKFSPSDVRERGYWDDYQQAFEATLSHTSTPWAPWSVVPADHKWFTRLATAAILVTAMHTINPRYPAAAPAKREQMAQVRNELEAELGSSREP